MLKREFAWTWYCGACNHEVEGIKAIYEEEGETLLSQVANKVLVSLDPQCPNCGSMNVGKIAIIEIFDVH